jgi:adenylate cyclase
MAKVVTLELYVLEGSAWRLERTADGGDRTRMLDTARQLEGGGKGVCVVRETRDDASGDSQEAVLYKSKGLSVKLPGSGGAITASAPPPVPRRGPRAEDAPSAPARRRPASSGRREQRKHTLGVMRSASLVLLSFFISLISGGLLAAITYFGLEYAYTTRGLVVAGGSQNWVYGAFLGGMLLAFLYSATRFERGIEFWDGRPAPSPTPAPAFVPPPAQLDRPVRGSAPPIPEPDAAPEEAPPEEAPPEEAPPEPTPATAAPPPVPPPPRAEPTPVAAPVVLGAAGRAAEQALLKLITGSLREAKPVIKQIDRMMRFGLLLYFCGAGEAAGTHHGAAVPEVREVLMQHMAKLGYSRDKTQAFIANLDEYLLDARNSRMYQAGRAAMTGSLAGRLTTSDLLGALQEWNTPAGQKRGNHFVAILFTDIVASTELTQKVGDALAQQVVRQHNAIVRGALQTYAGREVKHTGDGIMAVFDQSHSAVNAAVQMQREFNDMRRSQPDLPLYVRIGINAGEPIHEDGDVFGTPVQLAARLLNEAGGEEIAVSEVVKRLCEGKPLRFTPLGNRAVKGFRDPVELYRAEWRG